MNGEEELDCKGQKPSYHPEYIKRDVCGHPNRKQQKGEGGKRRDCPPSVERGGIKVFY